jgi:hypothetical protein
MNKEIGLDRITPSGLMLYRACPKAFYYAVWLGLKLPQSKVHLEFGTAIHEAIDTLYGDRNENGTWNGEESAVKALVVFNNRFKREHADSDKQFVEMSADGLLILKDYWNNKEVLLAKGFDPIAFEIPGKEIMHNPVTNEPLPIPMSYRLDAILKDHGVGEFKTSSTLYDPFEARSRPQSLCYVWAYYQKYKVIPNVHYVVMLKKKKKNKIQHLKFVYTMADILSFDQEVRSILEKIKNREFARPMKGHPYFCDCDKFEDALAY